jgi:stage IV sporulation protein FB
MRSSWRVGTLRGIPIEVHWTVLLGLPWYYYLNRSATATAVAFVAFSVLLLMHELGHAAVARWRDVAVGKIRLLFMHGSCTHEEPYYEEDDVLIAWGGVAAQLVVLALALVARPLVAELSPAAFVLASPLFAVLINTNLFMIVFNLLPIAPLDGAKAWRALPLLRERARQTSWAAGVRRLLSARQRAREKKLEAESARIASDIIDRLKKGKSDAGNRDP